MKKPITAVLFWALIAVNIPFAEAVPASRGGKYMPQMESCSRSVKRFPYGSGRRSSSVAVLITMRQQILNASGMYNSASSYRTVTEIPESDEAYIRLFVRNASIYDVGQVRIKHMFKAAQSGLRMTGVASLSGAAYDPRGGVFTIGRIQSGKTATVEFRMLLNKPIGDEISQSIFELDDFMVMESKRRFPSNSPDTSRNAIGSGIVKLGMGGRDVACFVARKAKRTRISDGTKSGGGLSYDKRAGKGAIAGTELPPASFAIPQTGADTSRIFFVGLQIIMGILIAFGLFGMGLWVVSRKAELY